MDAFGHPHTRRITIKKGSQTGGTEALYNMLMYAVDRAPGLTMFIYPDAGSGREQKAERLDPTIRDTPIIAARLGKRRGDDKTGKVRFDSMSLLYRGSVNEHQMESFPCRYAVVDELDRCDRRTAHLAYQRIKTYPDGKLVLNGKPSIEGVGIDLEYSRSDQRVYMVPCPHCGVYHERTFARVRWPGLRDGELSDDTQDVTGGEVGESRARRDAWLKCPRCNGRCGAEHNHWQLRLGVWCPRGHSVGLLKRKDAVASDAAPTDQWEQVPGTLSPPDLGSEHEGYEIPEWISGLVPNPYGEAAADFIARRGEMDQDWMADHAGKAWRMTGGSLEVKELRKAIEADNAAGLSYSAGVVPVGVLALIAAVDVQEAGCWVGVYGYGERGEHRYLVWHGYVPAPIGKLADLDAVLYSRKWARVSGGEMTISARCIDTGDRTDEVYGYIRARAKICGVRGVGVNGPRTQRMDQPYLWRRVEQLPNGQKLPGGVSVLRINSAYWKHAVMRRLGLATGREDAAAAMGLTEAGGTIEDATTANTWHLPRDVAREYLDQLTAEHYVRRVVRGKAQEGWELRPGRRDNHAFDIACYAEALADSLGIRRLTTPQGAAVERTAPAEPTQAAPRMNRPQRPEPSGLLARARQQRRE